MGKKNIQDEFDNKSFKRNQRKAQKEQGYFDGRFVERSETPKKKYSRKVKYKKKIYDEFED